MIPADQILLTGGSGLLGSTLEKLAPAMYAPTHAEFDLTDSRAMGDWLDSHTVTTIIHGAAFTSPPKIDEDPARALEVNIIGTARLVELAARRDLRLVYISTDYVFRGDRGNYGEDDELLPQNKYAWSKLGGECALRLYDNSLIIRTSFCEPVFPYPKAFVDQYTPRDSVEIIAPLILELARRDDVTGVVHAGTERKSVQELAQKLGRPEVGDLRRDEVSFAVPADTSFNLAKLHQILDKESS